MTFPELLASLKDEWHGRYRSRFLVAGMLAFSIQHWRVIVFLSSGPHTSFELIEYIEANVSIKSTTSSLAYAVAYVIVIPWIQLTIDWLASFGIRQRNAFNFKEREMEVRRRMIIADEIKLVLELEQTNSIGASTLTDRKLAVFYQQIIGGDAFPRWLTDIERGAVNSLVGNTIQTYLSTADTVEGKFLHREVENAHFDFVSNLSALQSTLNDNRGSNDPHKLDAAKKFCEDARDSQRAYRTLVRLELEV